MPGLIRLSMLLFVCLSVLRPAAVAAEASDASQVATWIGQLGDDSPEVRRQASQHLAKSGLQARSALEAGLADPDAEVRRRCRWILEDVLKADYQRRLKAFVADRDGRRQCDLPGWERMASLVGRKSVARRLFAEMCRSESGLLISAAAGPQPAAESLELRLRQTVSRMTGRASRDRRAPSVGTIAAILLISSDPELDLPPRLVDGSALRSLIQQPVFTQTINSSSYSLCIRKLLGEWIKLPTTASMLHAKLRLAVQYDVEEGVDLAVRTIRDRKKVGAHWRLFAVAAIGQLGGKKHAATLAELLDDADECARRTVNGVTTKTEIRDVALAWLIHLTGQSHADYGQEHAKREFERLAKNRRHHVNASQLGLTPERRSEALKKWRAYVSANPLPKLPDGEALCSAKPALRPASPAPGQPAAVPDRHARQWPGPGTESGDRARVRNLEKARQLCAKQRYAEAAQLLDDILRAESDCSFQPDSKVPLYRCLKPAAEQLLAGLPEKGRQIYKLRFEPLAGRLLAEAVAAGDCKLLGAVADRFFYTTAGAEATYLAAVDRFNRGHPLRAALYLQRLGEREAEVERFEPGLSALLAACWFRAGMPQAAERVLLQMRGNHTGNTVSIAGRERSLFGRPDEALDWLEDLIGPAGQAQMQRGWATFGGDPTRNAVSDAGGPFLRATPLAAICGDRLLKKTVEQLHKKHLAEHRVALPQSYPLVVGETILLRTPTHVRALDFASGRTLWESPLEDPLRHFLDSPHARRKEPAEKVFEQEIERRFWEDATFGTISSNGRYVFGVEDFGFACPADYQRMVVTPDGRRRLDPGSLKKHNLLAAYDVRSGKLKWEIGGPPGVEGVSQPGALFLGPPLPLGQRLYAIVDVGNETRLLELDSETGEAFNSLCLAEREQQPTRSANLFVARMAVAPPSRGFAASPSYADGILVFPTPDNRFVAVDLTVRRVLWTYRAPAPRQRPNLHPMIIVRGMASAGPQAAPGHRWIDAGVMIAEGRVLLTPPGCETLICLDLAEGRPCWSTARGDGLYLGGVGQGRAIIVGRGGVRAVRLDDGTPAWPAAEVSLPPGAVPSGRGYLSSKHYHLPLSTAEVAAIEVGSGRMVSRSRSPGGIVPGNLVAYRGCVISQDVDAIRRFLPLASRQHRLATALREKPDDPQLLTSLGEALLYDGRLVDAATILWRSLQIEPTPRTRQMLIATVIEGLRLEVDGFRNWADRVGSLIEDPRERLRFLEQLAFSLQRAGHVEEAIKTYLERIDAEPDAARMKRFAAGRVARSDRWIRARLEELRSAADPKGRAVVDRLIAVRLQDDRSPYPLAYFGSHPTAGAARLRLAGRLAEQKKHLPAEQLLCQVLNSGDDARQPEAIARLALLMRAAGRPRKAARFYESLHDRLAKTVCLDGKTGAELFLELPADDPIHRRLSPLGPWAVGEFNVETSSRSPSSTRRFPLGVMSRGGHLDGRELVEFNFNTNKFVGRDRHGRQLWQVEPKKVHEKWNVGSTIYLGGSAWNRGHLSLMRVARRIVAVDTTASEAAVLWSKEISASATSGRGLPMIQFGFAPGLPFGMGAAGRSNGLPASAPLSLAVASDCICFLQGRELMSVDPLSGKLLWSRDDMREGSDLFGDDRLLMATAPGAEQARVFSVVDGGQLGIRRVPPLSKRMWTRGRRVVTWSKDQATTRLTLTDPWLQKDVWQREFSAKAQPWLIGGDEAAVVDPQGSLVVVGLKRGDVRLRARIDPAPDLEGIIALRSAERYVLIVNRSHTQAQPVSTRASFGSIPVNGRVYGFERGSGKKLWQVEAADLALRADYPAELPVLVFLARTYKREQSSVVRSQTKLLCLDARNGRQLHSETFSTGRSDIYDINADEETGRIEIQTDVRKITLTLGEAVEGQVEEDK